MFTTKKTVTIVALALAGALSVGAVAAQAQSGAVSHSDSRTPATSVSPTAAGDDNGLRGDGAVDDHVSTAVTPTTTPAPSTGLPTDADHPQGDNSVGPGDSEHAGEEVGEDVGETNEVSDAGVSDDAAGHDVSDNHGAKSGDDAGHDSADSAENGDSGH